MRCDNCGGVGFLEAMQGMRIRCEDCRGTGYRGGKERASAVPVKRGPESPIGRLTPRQFLLFLACLWIAAYLVAMDIKALLQDRPVFPPFPFHVLFWAGIAAATKLFAIHREDRIRRQGLGFILFALAVKLLLPFLFEREDLEKLREAAEHPEEVVAPPETEAASPPRPGKDPGE